MRAASERSTPPGSCVWECGWFGRDAGAHCADGDGRCGKFWTLPTVRPGFALRFRGCQTSRVNPAPSPRALLGLGLAMLLAAGLRLYPMWAPYLHPEQDLLPRNAVMMLVDGNWTPRLLHHGSGFIYVLRVMYTLWYGLGLIGGWYHDRVDVLVAFVRNPLPFYIAGRLFVAACSILSVYLAARLAVAVSGQWSAAVAAAFLLAGTLIHVRGSHLVWQDVPAGTAVLGAAVAALRARASGSRAWLALTGALGGAALGTKHSMLPVVPLVVLAALALDARSLAERLRHLVLAGIAAVAAYAVLSPYTFLRFSDVLFVLKWQSEMFTGHVGGLDLPTLIGVGIGWGMTMLAAIGLVAAARSVPLATAIAAAFPAGYLFVLATGSLRYARYLAPLAPFVATFAGIGAAALGSLVPRGASALATAVLVVAVGAGTLGASLGYDRLLGQTDTRDLAGEWILAHVPSGTTLSLPTAHGYSNPTLPPPVAVIQRLYPAHAETLLARGAIPDTAMYPQHYFVGMFGQAFYDPAKWKPQDHWIVLAHHRGKLAGAVNLDDFVAPIERAGGRQMAHFRARESDDGDPVYDPIDADFTPLAGFELLERPGPEITIWELPAR